jgi:hypothetical protein
MEMPISFYRDELDKWKEEICLEFESQYTREKGNGKDGVRR